MTDLSFLTELSYITLKEGWLSVGSFKVVFEGGRRLDSEYEARTASGYLKFARGGTKQISKIPPHPPLLS